ncbi:hypothetical protein ACIGBL_33695 [Streptomyces sp. NPDC085614]|uniref:hypothetical protein n=1 Tax=Streptomyces sp. NPDC085614 TaxID=3365733 RepID=UPI0037D6C25B
MFVRDHLKKTVIGTVAVMLAGGGTVLAYTAQDSDRNVSAYCGTLQQIMEPQPGASGKEYYERLNRLVNDLKNQAPENLEKAASDYSNGVSKAVEMMSKVDYKPEKLKPEQVNKIQTKKMTEAASAILDSSRGKCGIKPQPKPSKAPANPQPSPKSSSGPTKTRGGSPSATSGPTVSEKR